MNIANHVLSGDKVTFQESPNHSGAFARSRPDTIVMHFTAGGKIEGSVNWLCNPNAKASAHVVIGRDGSVVQLVPFNTIAWHAGTSSWKERSGLNKYSIGIEMANAGALNKQGDRFLTSFNSVVAPENVFEGTHRNETQPRYWEAYTEAQIERSRELCALLISTYKIKEILGHEEIAPSRKTDPGPAYPLDKLRNDLLLAPENEEVPVEVFPMPANVNAANGLNIRGGAGSNFKTIANPLNQGQPVTILEEKQGWYRVRTSIEGWVHADYVQKPST